MGLSLLESLRRLIRQDTNRIGGPVGNLHGVVVSQLDGLVDGAAQSWLTMEVPGAQVPDLEVFYQNYGIIGGRLVLLLAQDGRVTAEAASGSVTLIRSAAIVRQRTTFTFKVEAVGNFALYVDGTLVRRGQGASLIPVSLDPGTHEVAILTNSERTTVVAPIGLELQGDLELPGRPVWVRITTEYLDPSIGTAANTLSWVSDPRVGGYYVLRRQRRSLKDTAEGASATDSFLLAVGELGSDGSFPITIEGRHETQVSVGDELLSEYDTIGVVTQVGTEAGTNTTLRCRAMPGTLPPTSALVGSQVFVGTFSPLTQITRTTNAPTLTYVDNTVIFGEAYEYALVAYGLVNSSLRGLRSEVYYIVAGDSFPPSSIVFAEGYPKSENGFVTVRFTTPPERDYQGVNVYFHERIQNEAAADVFVNYKVASVSGRIVTINDPELPAGALVNYKVRVSTGQEYTIVSNTVGTFTVERDFARVPVANEDLEIYRNIKIKTDYGLPDTQDELSFTATEVGRYVFCTFDRSGNEQDDRDAAYFDLFSLTGGGEGQPLVAFRQLIPSEQAFFAAPYNDTTQYAIVELWGYNSGVSSAVRFNGVELFYRRRSDPSDRMITPVPYSGQAFPWVVSGAPQAILDAPNWVSGAAPPIVSGGITSRYVHLDRSEQDNWIRIWAENAAGFSTDILTFVVDYDTTPEITSLETSIDNDVNTVTFTAVIDDDTQGFKWWVLPADSGEPTEAAPTYRGSNTLKTLSEVGKIALPLGKTKTLYVKPYSTWTTITATVTGYNSTTKVVTVSGTPFPTANGGMVNWQFTYPTTSTRFKVSANTANTVTVPSLGSTLPNGTVITVAYATGTEGETIQRELVRTPRSFVAFENKDNDGNRDATKVTAVFTQVPAPAELNPAVTGSGVVSLTGGFNLVDTGKSWTANQYSSGGNSAWYYARLVGVGGKTIVRIITANTSNRLSLGDGLPEGFQLSDFATCSYSIIDGAVMVRYRTDETASLSSSGFAPTAGRQTYTRDATFYLDYYATKNGCLPENVRSILVDPDTGAQFKDGMALTYQNGTPGRLTALAKTPDDDCKYWELYLKRGGWPVTSGTPENGSLDKQFLRYISSSVSGDSLQYVQNVEPVNGTTWYGIGVPFNSFNQEGKRAPAQVTINTSGADPDALLSLNWSVADAATTATATVTAQIGVIAAGASFTITAFDNADPGTTYTGSGSFAANGSGDAAGSATISLPFTVSTNPTANQRTWTVRVTSGARSPLSITRTMYAVVGTGGGTPSVTAQATTLVESGFCPQQGACASGAYRPLILRANFTTSGCSTLIHEVEVDYTIVPGTGTWTPVGWGISPTNGVQSYDHGWGCLMFREIGTPTDIQYRVRVIRKDNGTTVATATAPLYSTKLFNCQGYIPGDGEI